MNDKQKKYIKAGGIRCPFCDSEEIDNRGDVQTDLGVAWQDVECLECHALWTDQYELVGFETDEI